MSRTIKQIIYGTLYLLVFAGIIWGVWFRYKPAPSCTDKKLNQNETEVDCGGACESCDIRRLNPITGSVNGFFSTSQSGGDEFSSALVALKNPNGKYGASQIFYRIVFYGSDGTEIKHIDRQTFIYPSEIKYIFESDDVLSRKEFDRAQLIVSTTTVTWVPFVDFTRPKTSVRSINIVPNNVTHSSVVQGTVVNDSADMLRKATIVVTFLSDDGSPYTASKTERFDIAPGEARAFEVFVPSDPPIESLQGERVKIFVEAVR